MTESEWTTGRAGMLYRDVTPENLRPHVIASHIRLPFDGEVPDYVHYHKIEFQVIYCLKGRIKVVYETYGEAFWLEAGDLVVQPPEIRHRVLECEANFGGYRDNNARGARKLGRTRDEIADKRVKAGQNFRYAAFCQENWAQQRLAEANFSKTMLDITKIVPISPSIKGTIHRIIPAIQEYLATVSSTIGS